MTPKQAVKFAKKHMLTGRIKKVNMKNEWKTAWRAFLTTKEAIDIQKKAADSVASKSWYYCEKYKMKNCKAFCWFFDVVTQNGSLKGIPAPTSADLYPVALKQDGGKNYSIWERYEPELLGKILFVWIYKRVARNRWAADVISRKGTLAHGTGIVHGKRLDKLNNLYNEADKKVRLRLIPGATQ